MVRIYGNWCGPGWTAGQHKDAKELTQEDRNVPAVDAFDELCKEHDIGLHDAPFAAAELNARFADKAKQMGIRANLAGKAVEHFGPSPQPLSKTPSTTKMIRRIDTLRLRREAQALEQENRGHKRTHSSLNEAVIDGMGNQETMSAIDNPLTLQSSNPRASNMSAMDVDGQPPEGETTQKSNGISTNYQRLLLCDHQLD